MGASARPPFRRRAAVVVGFVSLALAFLVVAPMGALAAPSNASPLTIKEGPAVGELTARALWNGVNIVTANTTSSAFHISFNGAVNVVYTFAQPPGAGAAWSINDARLQIFYFGFALGTRDITESVGMVSGTITMGNWSTGPLQYILAGTYLLTASLIAVNGTTAWSQSFWVDVAAPYYILALLPIVLILLSVYEAYALCCSGKHVSRGKVPGGGTPPATPASTGGGGSGRVMEPPDPAVASTPPPGGAT